MLKGNGGIVKTITTREKPQHILITSLVFTSATCTAAHNQRDAVEYLINTSKNAKAIQWPLIDA